MTELSFINSPQKLSAEFNRLSEKRKKGKLKKKRAFTISKKLRTEILNKTDGKCHVCGTELQENKFEADHVKSHSVGGKNEIENFLPACKTCNNYRWNYSPEEMQWIIKLGVWVKNEIRKETSIGKVIATGFVKAEERREKRRKHPRL